MNKKAKDRLGGDTNFYHAAGGDGLGGGDGSSPQ